MSDEKIMINVYPHVSSARSMMRYLRGLNASFALQGIPFVCWYPESEIARSTILKKYLGYFVKALKNRTANNLVLSERFSFLLWALKDETSIVICHDLVTLWSEQTGIFHRFWYKALLRSMAKARYVVCISNSTKGDLLKFAPYISLDKVKVVHNGIEQFWFDKQELQGFVPSFDKLLLQSEVYLLSVGTDTWNKNLKMLLEAFRELIDMKIRLIRVGSISNANTTLIDSWNLSDKIVHLTNVSDLELKWLYSRAMALVFPSIHEGFGWPPLEAMAVGCPVIVSNTSSMPEVCGKAAVYINPHDSKSIVDAVKVLLSNHNFRNEIIRLGRLQAANFEWAVSAKKIFHLFKSMKK